MNRPDFESIRAALLATEDAEVSRVVRILDAVFRSPRYRPSEDTPSKERDLIAAVRAVFPTPFARKFAGWVDAQAEYREALGRWADPTLTEEARDRATLATSRRFRDAFLEMWTCWLQIVHFLPFILMASLRRLDDAALKQHAAKELAHALYHYKTFYEKYQNERRREADQLHLLIFLNKLFRRLSREGVLKEDFLFQPLMRAEGAGYSDVFPERFDANMRLLQQVRNSIIHGRVENRPPQVTEPIDALVTWSFLDIIATLAPLCRAFGLSYAAKLIVGPPGTGFVEVEALDFSAIDGPRETRYRLTGQPQVDDYALVDHRLYLIAKARQMGSGEGGIVEPRDYLDLTPFLIIERLRAQQLAANPSPENRQRILFALEQYFEPLHQLVFSELGGISQRTLTTAGGWETQLLLETIERFKARASQLTSQISLSDGHALSLAIVRGQLWLLSKGQLGSLLDAGRFDESGALLADMPRFSMRPAYDPDLFVEPPDAARLKAFFESDRRCVLLAGASGLGKSTLLVHLFLAQLRSGRLAAFLSGRQFDLASFREILLSKLVAQVSGSWRTLDDLDAFLDDNGEILTIFVDAINEYSGAGGPLPLLADMIAVVKSEPALRRCKIVVTCRTETWVRYTQRYGGDRPLDPALFFAPDGDALRVASFEDVGQRAALFAAYQRHYDLRPRTFEQLAEPVRALIAQPFMMALIAESYGNGGEIPGELDYFSLFTRLTERKQAAAQILWPAADILGREQLPKAIEEFCEIAAEMMYARLIDAAPAGESGANRDALPVDAVNKSWGLQNYVRSDGPMTVLDAVLQVGLMDQIRIPQRDRQGRVVSSGALSFFHDQYTQYWLAAAYQQSILGWLDRETLASQARFDELCGKITMIISRSVNAPVLAGALDHWLQKNLEIFHGRKLEAIVPLLDHMAAHDSASVRYHLVAMVTNLIVRRFLRSADVYATIFRTGSAKLRLELVNAFVYFWNALPPEATGAFIDACDPDKDKEPLERLGDIYALRLRLDPQAVVDQLNNSVNPISLGSVIEPRRFWRQFRFSLQFTIFSVMTCFDLPASVAAVRAFFRANYRPLLDLLTEPKTGFSPAQAAKRTLRQFLFARFDAFGLEQWDKFIAAMPESGNDRFFTDNDGVVQQEVLREFLPYVMDLHNGDWDRLSLAPGSRFRALALSMLDYRPVSIIGYNATLCLPGVLLRAGWSTTEALVKELIGRRTPSALFFGNLLLANLSYSDPSLAGKSLVLIRDHVVPTLLGEGLTCDWSVAFCIAALDIERLWPEFEAILRQLLVHFEQSADADGRAAFGDALYKICYCHDIAFGRRLIELLLREREAFLGPLWRDTSLKVFAAMLARSPSVLRAACHAEGVDDGIIRSAQAAQSEEIVRQSRLFPFQVDINRFLAWLYLSEPRLRHPVVKYFIGSLAVGDSVGAFAAGVRQTLVAFINVFFGDDPETALKGRLSIEEITDSVKGAGDRGRGAA